MTKKYLEYFPKILLDDFVTNKVVPFIGAGFSKNAKVSGDINIPDWDGLGKIVAKYIPEYNYNNALETLSLFEEEYSRSKLIEIIAQELHIKDIVPGDAHRALCDLNFNIICTTNFDTLLEKSLDFTGHNYSLIVSEDRLGINTKENTRIIKLHGDINHPERMIITENDYDTFIDNNKLLTTYVSNIFITQTLLLIGYSMDDNDIRTLWSIVNSRLGKLHRPAYAILVAPSKNEISKFERRNIKVIALPGKVKDYEKILTEVFKELRAYIEQKTTAQMTFTNERIIEDVKLGSEGNLLCFISASYKKIAFLKNILYPILFQYSITPVVLEDAILPGDSILRKMDTLLNQVSMAIIDISDNNDALWVCDKLKEQNKLIFLISEKNIAEDTSIQFIYSKIYYYSYEDQELNDFIYQISNSIKDEVNKNSNNSTLSFNEKDYDRLMEKGEYVAAVISAFRSLEITLRNRSDVRGLVNALNILTSSNQEDMVLIREVKSLVRTRNVLVHTNKTISKNEARNIINKIEKLCGKIDEKKITFNYILK